MPELLDLSLRTLLFVGVACVLVRFLFSFIGD